jgi:hypothetical protein
VVEVIRGGGCLRLGSAKMHYTEGRNSHRPCD